MLTLSKLTLDDDRLTRDPHLAALERVADAARSLRQARADWDAGCPDPLAPRYMALNIALEAMDALERTIKTKESSSGT